MRNPSHCLLKYCYILTQFFLADITLFPPNSLMGCYDELVDALRCIHFQILELIFKDIMDFDLLSLTLFYLLCFGISWTYLSLMRL